MENFSVSNVLKLIPLLLVLLVLVIPKGEGDLSNKVVRVQNDLGEVTLMVHCRSKDDDTGVHYLTNGKYTEWSFHSGIGTLFRCTIKWNGEKEDFTVYDPQRDLNRCWLKCWWSIRPDGAYSFNENSRQYEKLGAWSK